MQAQIEKSGYLWCEVMGIPCTAPPTQRAHIRIGGTHPRSGTMISVSRLPKITLGRRHVSTSEIPSRGHMTGAHSGRGTSMTKRARYRRALKSPAVIVRKTERGELAETPQSG